MEIIVSVLTNFLRKCFIFPSSGSSLMLLTCNNYLWSKLTLCGQDIWKILFVFTSSFDLLRSWGEQWPKNNQNLNQSFLRIHDNWPIRGRKTKMLRCIVSGIYESPTQCHLNFWKQNLNAGSREFTFSYSISWYAPT